MSRAENSLLTVLRAFSDFVGLTEREAGRYRSTET
jgi:hypothetical protein